MPFISPKTYNVQNPLHFNYPKAPFLRGSQYSTYPKFRQTNHANLIQNKGKDINSELTKVLEKEIDELKSLTEQAKKLSEIKRKEAEAKKILLRNKNLVRQQKSFLQVQENSSLYKIRRRRRSSNLDQVRVLIILAQIRTKGKNKI